MRSIRATDSSPRTRSSPRAPPRTASPSSDRPSTALEMAGNKVTAKHHAIAAGVPVLRSTEASEDVDALVAQAADIGFPIFVKAVAGGGGRGMRRVETPGALAARDRRGDARGGRGFRRRARVPRAGRRAPASHRGADPRRRDGSHRPPVRARLLGAAPPPEGHRDRARAQPLRRAARGAAPRRRGFRRIDRLRQRRNRRVPAWTRRASAPASTCSSR